MTTSGVNQSTGPVSALVALGQQSRDGAGKNPSLDFAGLLSRLSAAADAGGGAKQDQSQPPVVGGAIETMPKEGRDGKAPASVVQTHHLQRNSDDAATPVDETQVEEDTAANKIANAGEEDLTREAHVEVEPNAMTPGNVVGGDTTVASTAKSSDPGGEVQLLLTSILQTAKPETQGVGASHASVKAASTVAAGVASSLLRTDTKPSVDTSVAATRPADGQQDSVAGLLLDIGAADTSHVELNTHANSAAASGDTSLVSDLAGDMKLSVLQTQTHHAPVLHGGPMAQVAESIRAELAASGDIALTWSPSDATTAKPGADAPVKVLLIQLQPADLGTVTVRMSLKEDALELHIEASQQETAQRLQKDQDSLSKVLRSAGYLIDGVAIRVTEPDRSLVLPSPGSSTLSQSSYQGTAGGAPSEGGMSQGRGQNEHAARGHAGQNPAANASGQQQSSSGGLYI
jgi:chemotaxis protein MotD